MGEGVHLRGSVIIIMKYLSQNYNRIKCVALGRTRVCLLLTWFENKIFGAIEFQAAELKSPRNIRNQGTKFLRKG